MDNPNYIIKIILHVHDAYGSSCFPPLKHAWWIIQLRAGLGILDTRFASSPLPSRQNTVHISTIYTDYSVKNETSALGVEQNRTKKSNMTIDSDYRHICLV